MSVNKRPLFHSRDETHIPSKRSRGIIAELFGRQIKSRKKYGRGMGGFQFSHLEWKGQYPILPNDDSESESSESEAFVDDLDIVQIICRENLLFILNNSRKCVVVDLLTHAKLCCISD